MPFAQAALAQQTLGAGGVTGKLVLMTAAAASFVIIACRGPAANELQRAVETTMCQNSLQFTRTARNAVNAISQSTSRSRATVSAVCHASWWEFERSMLDVEVTGRGERRVLFLSGQLDLDSASQLDRALEAVCADGVREVVLNLQKVDFIDTTGLGTILSGRTLCKQHGCRYFIDTPVPASFKRLLDVTGIQRYLPFKRRLGT